MIRKKKVKVLGQSGDELSKMFNQMTGAGEVDIEVVGEKYDQLAHELARFATLTGFLAALRFMKTCADMAEPAAELTKFSRECEEYAASLTDLAHPAQTETEAVQAFGEAYAAVKHSAFARAAIVTCDNLIPHKAMINESNLAFITSMPGISWSPLPYTALDVKYMLEIANDNFRALFAIVVKKLLEVTYSVWKLVTSPDVDIKKFIAVIEKSIDQLHKVPELNRCGKAFARVKASIGLLEERFGSYYRDSVATKDSTILLQHFIIDVSKESSVDAETTMQFRKIISYYQKVSKYQNHDPKIKSLFSQVSGNLDALESVGKNIVKIETEERASHEEDAGEDTPTSAPPDAAEQAAAENLHLKRVAAQDRSADDLAAEIDAINSKKSHRRRRPEGGGAGGT